MNINKTLVTPTQKCLVFMGVYIMGRRNYLKLYVSDDKEEGRYSLGVSSIFVCPFI